MTSKQATMPMPLDMVTAYWNEVEKSLRRGHSLSNTQTLRAILRYRNKLDAFGIARLVYESSPYDVASHIVSEGYTKAYQPPAD